MKTAIATVSIPGNLDDKIAAIAAAGFDGIEIFEQDFLADHRSPREVAQMIADAGLELLLFQPFRDFEGLTGDLRRRAFDRAERKFDLMGELGTDLLLVCSSVHPAAQGGIDRAADDLAELGARAEKRGLRIGYEALAWGRHVDDHRDAWEIVRRAGRENVGLILDSFHTLARRIDPETIRRIPGDRIFFVQLADAPRIEMDLLYLSRHFRNMPGEGDLPVKRFLQAVLATGYAGPVSLEIFNDQFRSGVARMVAADGYRSIAGLIDDVRRDEPGLHLPGPDVPARQALHAVEFLEFTARGADNERLEAFLRSLGFQHTGRHINKDLELWQQGDIRLVLNAQSEGHAARIYNVRGVGVCDIGLRVADAAATVERAQYLGAEPFAQPHADTELTIPAIRGLSGGVLHFLDEESGLTRVWELEFEPVEPLGDGAGLTRVDHIAQTMRYDEMLSWSLFFTTLFEMKKTPMVDVVDPDGLVRSQALADPLGALRITLNGAETHRTLAGGFLAESFGASVQHIAFGCDDIFDTCERLAALGFEPLAIPSNYYDDLASRFDLPAGLLARMKAAHVLYDEADGCGFFQCYSQPFSGGMFIEIVQRDAGYAGYGAPNAPFRIAALKRRMPPKGMPAR